MPLSGTPRPRGEGRQAEGREGDRRVGRTVVAGRGRRTEDVDAGWGLGSSAVWGPG